MIVSAIRVGRRRYSPWSLKKRGQNKHISWTRENHGSQVEKYLFIHIYIHIIVVLLRLVPCKIGNYTAFKLSSRSNTCRDARNVWTNNCSQHYYSSGMIPNKLRNFVPALHGRWRWFQKFNFDKSLVWNRLEINLRCYFSYQPSADVFHRHICLFAFREIFLEIW